MLWAELGCSHLVASSQLHLKLVIRNYSEVSVLCTLTVSFFHEGGSLIEFEGISNASIANDNR